MKKVFRCGAVVLLAVAAAMVVVYKSVNRLPSSDLPENEQVWQIFDDGGCLSVDPYCRQDSDEGYIFRLSCL